MIDFHSHILPNVDDGSESMEESLEMLRRSYEQGVDTVFLTSHFYAFEDNMESFLTRRDSSYANLLKAINEYPEPMPRVLRGAEVYYFPGMSVASDLSSLKLENTKCLLVEPPMDIWSDEILDEIEETGERLRLIPVIAHIDRYMNIFGDRTLIDQIYCRKLLAQVNASFFYSRETSAFALELFKTGKIQLIGSDAHNTTSRPPNIGRAVRRIKDAGLSKNLDIFNDKSRILIRG